MFELTIKKQGIITNGPSPFETLDLAEAHVAREEANKSYGELERVKPVIECSPEELAIALEIIPESIGEMGQVIPESARLPKMYEVIIEDVTARKEQERVNAEALAYLASTDYMIIREAEGGTPCSAEVKDERQAARDRIVN